MNNFHNSRMAEAIKREMTIILRNLKDPRINQLFLTIIRVDLSGDMSNCKIYISSIYGKKSAKKAVEILKCASCFIRRELFTRFKIKKIPKLIFIVDTSIERGVAISKKLNDLAI